VLQPLCWLHLAAECLRLDDQFIGLKANQRLGLMTIILVFDSLLDDQFIG
jgi:hypothetical protein